MDEHIINTTDIYVCRLSALAHNHKASLVTAISCINKMQVNIL